MIIYMSKIVCVTNRMLCKDHFINRMQSIIACKPKAVILREKDLSPQEYYLLAKQLLAMCQHYDVTCIFHNHVDVAQGLNHHAIHLPLPLLRSLTPSKRKAFSLLGTSCHSLEEAVEAENLGCTYIIVGHIFQTDCKKDLPPKGLDILQQICERVTIPVWAIGGLHYHNISQVYKAGATVGCIMSDLMTCISPKDYFKQLPEINESL